uniref:Uncharacterized protein n=1 Tax=Arundo donax TaxID=35708 RepID=A0A0A8XZG3_ARUDO
MSLLYTVSRRRKTTTCSIGGYITEYGL